MMICPACLQGSLVHVRIQKLKLEGFICDECEAFWEGNSFQVLDLDGNEKGKAFHIRMKEAGLPDTWD
jgi:hypothetical protein